MGQGFARSSQSDKNTFVAVVLLALLVSAAALLAAVKAAEVALERLGGWLGAGPPRGAKNALDPGPAATR